MFMKKKQRNHKIRNYVHAKMLCTACRKNYKKMLNMNLFNLFLGLFEIRTYCSPCRVLSLLIPYNINLLQSFQNIIGFKVIEQQSYLFKTDRHILNGKKDSLPKIFFALLKWRKIKWCAWIKIMFRLVKAFVKIKSSSTQWGEGGESL